MVQHAVAVLLVAAACLAVGSAFDAAQLGEYAPIKIFDSLQVQDKTYEYKFVMANVGIMPYNENYRCAVCKRNENVMDLFISPFSEHLFPVMSSSIGLLSA